MIGEFMFASNWLYPRCRVAIGRTNAQCATRRCPAGWAGRLQLALLLAGLLQSGCTDRRAASHGAPAQLVQAVGTGADGQHEVAIPAEIVNRYAALELDARRGDSLLRLSATLGVAQLLPLEPGAQLLIIQMQGAALDVSNGPEYGTVASLQGAGLFEFVSLRSFDAAQNTLTLYGGCGGLRNDYSAAGRTQIILVPQYATLAVPSGTRIVPVPWNGQIGGVVALQVQEKVTLDGSIDVSRAGFRGGARNEVDVPRLGDAGGYYLSSNALDGANKGEGIAGDRSLYLQSGAFGRGAPANGGGGGNRVLSGGGGGGNGGSLLQWNGQGVMPSSLPGDDQAWALDPQYTGYGNQKTASSGGGRGGYSQSDAAQNPLLVGPGDPSWGADLRRERGGLGGRPVPSQPGSRLFLGGGGGGGDDYRGSGGAGGAGGGLLFLLADSIAGSGELLADGEAGADTLSSFPAGGGGGGAGGTVFVAASQLTGPTIRASGGGGGSQRGAGSDAAGPGGGGGGGYVAAPKSSVTAVEVRGGAAGQSDSGSMSAFPHNGATDGHSGQQATTPDGLYGGSPVCASARLSVNLSSDPVETVGQQSFRITAAVNNLGPSAPITVSLELTLPAGCQILETAAGDYDCEVSGERVLCSRLFTSVGAAASIALTAVPPLGLAVLTATATAAADVDGARSSTQLTIRNTDPSLERIGGGGVSCSAAPGRGGASGLWALFGLAFASLWQRRGRSTEQWRRLPPLLAVLGVLLPSASAQAQNPGFQINRYEPTASGEWFFAVPYPYFSATRSFAAGAALNYAHAPLTYGITNSSGNYFDTRPIIEHQILLHLDVAASFFDRVTISGMLPVLLLENGEPLAGVSPAGGAGINDPRLGVMVRVWRQPEHSPVSISLGGQVWLPVRAFAATLPPQSSDVSVRFRPQLVLAGKLTRVRWSLATAVLVRPDAMLSTTAVAAGSTTGNELQLGAALGYSHESARLVVGPEVLLSTALSSNALRRDFTSLEILLGVQHSLASQVQLGLAFGMGALREPGTPDFRILLRLAYAPIAHDRDRDGIADKVDACPDQSGVASKVPSNHGCPRIFDRDCDSVPDAEDRCPDEPEGAYADPLRRGCARPMPALPTKRGR